MQGNAFFRHAGTRSLLAMALLAPVPLTAAELAPPEYGVSPVDAGFPVLLSETLSAGLSSTGAVVHIRQQGEANQAEVVQVDGNSVVTVRQLGDGNRVDILQQGSGHDASITQEGNRNAFSLTQSGPGQHLDVMQWGDGLSVQAAQR